MPIEVELPDGTIAEFPDGTSNATMEMALAKYRAPKADFSDVRSTVSNAPAKPKPASRHAGQYGITPYLMDFLDAGQHNAMNVLHGGAQLVTHGLSNLPGGVGEYFADVAAKDDAALRQREADYQARTQDNPSSYLGAGAGQLLPWVAGTGALRARGALPVANSTAAKAGLLSAEGALMGATTPVTRGGDYGAQKGSQIVTGAVAAPLVAAGLKGTSAGLTAASRGSRYLTGRGREAIANERVAAMLGPDALPALRAGSGVDGFVPTPAQAIGTPEAVQAERALRNNPMAAAAFAERESANNEALRASVARLAGTDEAMAAARLARAQATDPYYAQLPSAKADPAPVLAALDSLENSGLGVNKNVKAAVGSLRNEIKSRLDSEGKLPADVLSGLHSEAGSHLGPMATAQERKALGPVRDSIADALDAAVPGYRDNVAAYARLSQPISDMQAGRAVLGAIDSGARDAGGNQAVSLTQIKSALAKDAKARYPMSPQARKQLEAVRDALQQRSITNNTVAASGPGTAADVARSGMPGWMQRFGGQLAGGVGAGVGGLPGYLLATGAAEGAMAARNSVQKKIGKKASDSLLAAEAIEAARRDQANRGLLDRYLIPEYLLPYTVD